MGIDIKAYIPKTLPSPPNLDVQKIKDGIKSLDIKILGTGAAAMIFALILINVFVWFNSAATIEKLNAASPVKLVEIKKTENPNLSNKEQEQVLRNKFLIEGLSVDTTQGELPIIRKSDYLTSFRAYQTPFTFNKNNKKPIIAFIVRDYGLTARSSMHATKTLPPEISFMLSTYSNAPSAWISKAHSGGHEVWLQLPIQNIVYTDQGPNTIFHHASINEKQTKIYQTLSKTLGYVGLVSFTDQTFEHAKEDYSKLFDEIYNRGLGYLELNPNAPQYIKGKALTKGAPYIKANIEVIRMTGKQSFDDLEQIANTKGYALAIIPNHETAINNLAIWLEKIGTIDYQIAPVSAIYDIPTQANSKKSELRGEDLMDPDKYEQH